MTPKTLQIGNDVYTSTNPYHTYFTQPEVKPYSYTLSANALRIKSENNLKKVFDKAGLVWNNVTSMSKDDYQPKPKQKGYNETMTDETPTILDNVQEVEVTPTVQFDVVTNVGTAPVLLSDADIAGQTFGWFPCIIFPKFCSHFPWWPPHNPDPNPVPVPAAGLLMLGVLGIAAARKKLI